MKTLKLILVILIGLFALLFTAGVIIKYGIEPTVLGALSGLALWNYYNVFWNKRS